MKFRIVHILKTYPAPLFVFIGLAIGATLFFSGWKEGAEWVWLATLIGGGVPIVFRTTKGMIEGIFASDIVAMLAIITAVILEEYFAGAVVVLMQSGGEAIEAYGLRRASSSLRALMERAPRIARRKVNGGFEEVDVREVSVGETLLVRPGDFIPVDGTILKGVAEIDESAITGEPMSKSRREGEKVLSGSININGAIEMRADKKSSESQYAKIVSLVEKAQGEKAPIQRLADRYAIFFTPLTLTMCVIGYLITQEATTILAVLVVATPCPLILATPLAVICGINRAADSGIIVKGGAPIEQIASVEAALFDKTGTITFGTPFVEQVIAANGEKEEELLYHAAIVEQYSSHSIGQAIVKRARESHPQLPLPTHFREIAGRGVEGDIGSDRYTIGSPLFLADRLGKEWMEKHQAQIEKLYEKQQVLIVVAKNDRLLGFIALSDRIRPGAPSMIQELRTLGVKEVAMLTGDSRKNGEIISKQAGIHTLEAELLPEQKVLVVERFNKLYHPTLMVGDGINDAPALATATVGIAMGAYGTAISAEAANIVLLVDDLSKVSEAMRIGKRMLFIAKQSIWIGIGLSFILMVMAANGFIIPAVGALLQEIIDVAVILNALRAR